MPSNRWVVLALLFSVRVSTGIQYQAVASLSPELMSGFVLSIADIGLLIGALPHPRDDTRVSETIKVGRRAGE